MSEFIDNTENFLAKWLSGELTDEQKAAFEASEEYPLYKNIIEATDDISRPAFDLNQKYKAQKEYNLSFGTKTVTEIGSNNQDKTKVIRLRPWLYAAAAAVVLFLGALPFLFDSTVRIETSIAEKKTVILPDNSSVTLNAQSVLSYDKKRFLEDRNLQLEGEGFFEVEKGSTFTVTTTQGKIKVLGTKFNVVDRKTFLNIQCFEGRVQVNSGSEITVLSKGQGTSSKHGSGLEDYELKREKKPDWVSGVTTLNNLPISEVIAALKRQYTISIETSGIDTTRIFKGFFVHNNLESALQSCFDPMNIDYERVGENKIVLTRK